jgi:D-sedoheptulose 7-phosphate isomerase
VWTATPSPLLSISSSSLGQRSHSVLLRQWGIGSDVESFQNDLTRWRTKPMRVVSLTDNVAVITALANDYSYEQIFVMQLEPLLAPDDVVVVISASGNSPNVVKAVEFARSRKAVTSPSQDLTAGRWAACATSM